MKRIHLFEFEDQKWFPSILRNYGTDFLQFLSNKTKMYKPIIPILKELLDRTNHNQIVDLGSGGGGGLIWLNGELLKIKPNLKIKLTDLYPNLSAFEYTKSKDDNFEIVETPVDARKVSAHLKGIRTQFLSLHHLNEKDAIQVLQNAVDSNSPIAIFEAQERSIPSFLAMFFSPITVLLITPFIRPFKLGRIIFTYLIPIVPLFVWWDGMISSLRTYSVKEMDNLVSQVQNQYLYDWKIGKIKSGPGIILHLIGTPKHGMIHF
jgi:SAM-dependent methyltransferase